MKVEVDFEKEVVCIKCNNNNFDAYEHEEKYTSYLYLVCSECGWFLRMIKKQDKVDK